MQPDNVSNRSEGYQEQEPNVQEIIAMATRMGMNTLSFYEQDPERYKVLVEDENELTTYTVNRYAVYGYGIDGPMRREEPFQKLTFSGGVLREAKMVVPYIWSGGNYYNYSPENEMLEFGIYYPDQRKMHHITASVVPYGKMTQVSTVKDIVLGNSYELKSVDGVPTFALREVGIRGEILPAEDVRNLFPNGIQIPVADVLAVAIDPINSYSGIYPSRNDEFPGVPPIDELEGFPQFELFFGNETPSGFVRARAGKMSVEGHVYPIKTKSGTIQDEAEYSGSEDIIRWLAFVTVIRDEAKVQRALLMDLDVTSIQKVTDQVDETRHHADVVINGQKFNVPFTVPTHLEEGNGVRYVLQSALTVFCDANYGQEEGNEN